MKFEPKIESVSKHEVPKWFHDAKFGIFIHWGLYSVPAYAPIGLRYPDDITKIGIEEYLKRNPYAEWYLNTLRIAGNPTEKYHQEHYGKDFSYDDFIPLFNEAIKKWKPDGWADLFKKAGARYVVLVTKHHDGFVLWSSKYLNPKKGKYQASRDIAGELTKAVKANGMKMGFYYSGGLDWSVNPYPISDGKSFITNVVSDPEYIKYANNQWYELIDKYEPLILWNDIAYPPNTNINEIFAYFYNKFPEGVINDRWRQPQKGGTKFHYDFTTPEYKTFKKAKKQKWELTRGISNSFSFNQFDNEETYLTIEELVHLLIDVVSKNGNLLLNVGPMADGTIPEAQKKCLLGLGKWLGVNGEAIFGTRPWERAETKTSDNLEVRFTEKQDVLYLFLLGKPQENHITIKNLKINPNSTIELLGNKNEITWSQENDDLTILIPEDVEDAVALTFANTPKPNLS